MKRRLAMHDEMTIGQCIAKAKEELKEHHVELPERTAQWLWQHASGMSLHDMVMHYEDRAQKTVVNDFFGFIKRRSHREPLQYIVGEAEFYGLSFYVDQRVLIPRPDTEVLVDEAISHVLRIMKSQQRPTTVVDVGTGSGAIIVSLARALQERKIPQDAVHLVATDIEQDALLVAKQNAIRHGVASWIRFFQGNFLMPLPETAISIDLLISNPPYIPESDRLHMQPEVVHYEPASALFAGSDGLEAYRELVTQASVRMGEHGYILLETGFDQAKLVGELAKIRFPQARIEFTKDTQGIDRVVKVCLEVC